jgi:hypothetical protein
MHKKSIYFIAAICLIINFKYINCGDDEQKQPEDTWPGLRPGIPGGVSKIDTKLGAAKDAIKYFGEIEVVKLENVYSQIVAGIKYYYEGLFRFKGDSDAKKCRITVVSQPWLEPPYKLNIVGCQNNQEDQISM